MKTLGEEILRLSQGRATGVLITVVAISGSVPAPSGSKLLVYPDGSSLGTVGGGALEELARARAMTLFSTRVNALETFTLGEPGNGVPTGMLCGGTATLFFEFYAPLNHVYIFGAGHIGQALVPFLRRLAYHLTVIDDRQERLDQITGADQLLCGDFAATPESASITPDAFFVIATYQHQYDEQVLKRIFQSDWKPRYVGMVGSRQKQKRLFDALTTAVPNADLTKCFTPAGLNIGGDTPDEIALAIAAEIQAVRYQQPGGHLRQ